uniref:Amidase domain-containing protein n=1 Tax=Fagus sylvatica TaxID=28930 RepID=A0A2N9HXG3_FAGSY
MTEYVTGFRNPDWVRTHLTVASTAPAILAVLRGAKMCRSFNVYIVNGENKHYGTPRNPCVPDRVPGGSFSGSAVAVGAKLVAFALRILGFWPSHDAISTAGVIPLVQSFDTVGKFSTLHLKVYGKCFIGQTGRLGASHSLIPTSHLECLARGSVILNRVGQVLLQFPDVDLFKPSRIIIAEDFFQLLDIPNDLVTQPLVKSVETLSGSLRTVKGKVPSLKQFIFKGNTDQESNTPSLAALSSAMRLIIGINGENKHYGTPRNPCVPDRVPGGSVDLLLQLNQKVLAIIGTDTGGSVRVPAS